MMADRTKVIAISSLILRILTLASIIASIVLLVTDKAILEGVQFGSFKDLITYRYVLSIASISGAYTVLQLPFAVYYTSTGKRLIHNGYLPEFDFFGDKMISLLLATAVGAGFAVSIEIKRIPGNAFKNFYTRGNVATGVLLIGTVCMVLVSVLSSINYRTHSKSGIFG
ncbi:CASP-like protein 4D1 [Juglans microcarpa x Juglans regia]|uniref:CASP-like protein 4D1 n=1 Tax=Juglans microcarpa x Juglans regia TaxID=2249226 RepID=UPI001B7E89D0|nr:CASP-like protein 4D1 [Juglans microcarpa x Juglans regia]